MASPVVESRNEGSTASATTTHSISLPSGLTSGDLIIVIFSHAVASTLNAITGWTELVDVNSANAEKVLYRRSDGTEGSTLAATTSASTKATYLTYRISGAENPSTQAPEISTVATGTSTGPDATTVTPTGGAKDYRWISFFTMAGEEADDDTWCNNAPTNFGNLIQKSTTASGLASTNVESAAADYASNASSMDANAFNTDQSLAWRAYTIAIHPAGSTAYTQTSSVTATLSPALLKKTTLIKELTATAGLAYKRATSKLNSVTGGGSGGAVSSITMRINATSNADATTYTTTSFTPTANKMILAIWSVGEQIGPMSTATVSDTGNGLTWTLIDRVRFRGDPNHSRNIEVWYAQAPASPASMTVSITNNQDSGTTDEQYNGVRVKILEITAGGADGASVFNAHWDTEDNAPGGTNNIGTSWTTTATNFSGNSENRVLVISDHSAEEAITIEGTNLGTDLTTTLPSQTLAASWVSDSYDNTISHSWTSSVAYAGIAIELAAGTGSGWSVSTKRAVSKLAALVATFTAAYEKTYTPAGGTPYTKQADVSMTLSPGVTKAVTKLAVLTATLTTALTRRWVALKTISIGATLSVAKTLNPRKLVALGATGTVAASRVYRAVRSVAITATLTPAVTKATRLLKAIGATGTVAMTKLGVFVRTVAIGATLGIGVLRRTVKSIAQGLTGTVGFARSAVYSRLIAVGATLSAAVQTVKNGGAQAFSETVNVGATLAVSITKAVTKPIDRTITATVALTKKTITKILAVNEDPWGILAARAAITKPGGAVTITSGVHDPQTVINANPAGTTYWFDGTFNLNYEIYPKAGDTLLTNNAILDGDVAYTSGDRYTDGSVMTGAMSGIDCAVGVGRESVTIKGFEIRNYRYNGVLTWPGGTYQYLLLHDNHRNGIGGGLARTPGWEPQVLIEDCLVWDNGSVSELGDGAGGSKFAATGDGIDYARSDPDYPIPPDTRVLIQATAGSGIIVRRCYFYRNIGNGFWHDVASGGNLIENCISEENTRKGFHNEIAVGPDTWQDNTSKNNATWLYEAERPSSDWGLVVMTSLDTTVQRNYFKDNGDNNGIKVDEDGRVAETGHNTDGIIIQDNNLQGGDVYFKTGSVTGTVTATNNGDLGSLYGASYKGGFPLSLTGGNYAVAVLKNARKTIAQGLTGTIAHTRAAVKKIAQGLTGTVTMTRLWIASKTIALTATLTPVAQKATRMTKSIGATLTAAYEKFYVSGAGTPYTKLVEITSTMTVGAQRATRKVIDRTATLTAAISRRVITRTIDLGATLSLTSNRVSRKVVALTSTFTPAIVKSLAGRRFAVSLTATPVIRKSVGILKSLGATLTAAASTVYNVFAPGVHAEATATVTLYHKAKTSVQLYHTATATVTRLNKGEGYIDGY